MLWVVLLQSYVLIVEEEGVGVKGESDNEKTTLLQTRTESCHGH